MIDLPCLWRNFAPRTGELREDGEIWRADTRLTPSYTEPTWVFW